MCHQEELEEIRRKLDEDGWPQPKIAPRYMLPGYPVAPFRTRAKKQDKA